jgi:hypothetical protein
VIIRRFALPMAVRCETADFDGLDVESGHCARGGSSESSSQVKLLITNNVFCIVQRATAQSETGIFRDHGEAEETGFQAGWSDCMYFFSLFLFILFAHLEIIQPRHS